MYESSTIIFHLFHNTNVHAHSGLYTGPRFYDIWVARDARGQRFVEDPPFVLQASPSSSSAAASAVHGTESSLEGEKGIKGLSALPLAPFPVYCCWNGLAVLHTAPLYW